MSSHGVPRTASREERTAETRQKEFREIAQYMHLVHEVNAQVVASPNLYDFQSLLQKTAELLKKNPEYYTVWNHRRRIYVNEFEDLARQVLSKEIDEDSRISQVLDIIQLDLQFLFPLLLKFPKCYWIWNHRLWLLQKATILLPQGTARKIWEEELGLVGKMLNRDSRNFHGWGYRRTVVQSLESPALQGESMAGPELKYTKKMIGTDLSNFSAWHNRTKLIVRILNEENATDRERQNMFDEELHLIHKALFDPYDQSLWFYHQNLMCTLDPEQADKSMAPHLSKEQRLTYIASEREYIEEVLEDAQDSKWPYQALIECAVLEGKLKSGFQEEDRAKVMEWLQRLLVLDPLRKGRWKEMEEQLRKSHMV